MFSRQVFRQQRRGAPLLTRPGQAPARVWLDAEPGALAAAAAVSARMSLPIDCAAWLCAEALDAAGPRRLRDALAAAELRATDAQPNGRQPQAWIAQLTYGCDFYEDQLPAVVVPADLVEAFARVGTECVVDALCEPFVLEQLIRIERRAAIEGLRLGDLVGPPLAVA